MAKPYHFRPTEKAKTIIDAHAKKHKISINLTINQIVEAFQSEPSLPSVSINRYDIECPALVAIPERESDSGWFCANKAPKITPIPNLVICQFCWERQQKLKTAKNVPTSSTTPTMYKKAEKIYCIKDNLWLDPLKIQVKCTNCKLKEFYKWAECQRHNMTRTPP